MPENKPIVSVDESNGIPLWIQLRNQLVFLIASGHFKPNDRLPTVRELTAELGISYNTVCKVYQMIEREGYITTKRGRGTFVVDSAKAGSEKPVNETNLLADQFITQCMEMGVIGDNIVRLVESRLKEMHRDDI